jgi:hypothetical protein
MGVSRRYGSRQEELSTAFWLWSEMRGGHTVGEFLEFQVALGELDDADAELDRQRVLYLDRVMAEPRWRSWVRRRFGG